MWPLRATSSCHTSNRKNSTMGNSVSDFKESKSYIYRDRVDKQLTSTTYSTLWSGNTSQKLGPYSTGQIARCVDVNHPDYLAFRRRLLNYDRSTATYRRLDALDIGDSFAKESVSLSMPTVGDWSQPFFGLTRGYKGIAFPSTIYTVAMQNASQGQLPPIPADLGVDKGTLVALGATAIKKSLPDIPNFSLFRFAGELREGLPKIPLKVLTKERKLRAVGGEYLNYQFGIAPMVSDIQNFLEALQHPKFREAVKHHVNDSYRVRKVLDKGSTSVSRPMTSAEMSTNPGSGGTGTIVTTGEYRIWSSITFGYYQVRELDRLLNELDNMTGGIGVVPTAIDIWNLIPWSWLIDWFVNFNNVITNVSFMGRDGLYLKRGYIMGTYRSKEVHSRTGTAYGHGFSTTGTILSERKYRVKASPFGFGYTWKDFNPFQLSILGALGVNRLKF